MELSAQLAKVHSHSGAVEAFHEKVETEATPFASVDCIRRFPKIATKETKCLVTHATMLLSVQANLLNLAYVGAVTLAHIPDQFNATIWEVHCLAKRGSLPSDHCHWHTLKFEQERTKAQIEHQALQEWLCNSMPVTDCDMLSVAPLMQIAMKTRRICQRIVGGPAVAVESTKAKAKAVNGAEANKIVLPYYDCGDAR